MQESSSYQLTTRKRFAIAIIFNGIASAVGLIGGLLTGSLALISDGMHNFGDFLP